MSKNGSVLILSKLNILNYNIFVFKYNNIINPNKIAKLFEL